MQAWQRKLATAPLPVLFLVNAIVFGAGTYLVGRLVDDRHQSWVASALGGVMFGVVMTAWQARQRRRNGGAAGMLDIGQAIRREELPTDIDPEECRSRLHRHKRTFRWLRFVAPVEFGLFASLATWLAVTRGPVWWLFAAAFVGMGAFATVASVRALGKVQRLLGRLESRTQPS